MMFPVSIWMKSNERGRAASFEPRETGLPSTSRCKGKRNLTSKNLLIYHDCLCYHTENYFCAALRRGFRSLTTKPPENGLKSLHDRILRVSPLFDQIAIGSPQLSPLFHRTAGEGVVSHRGLAGLTQRLTVATSGRTSPPWPKPGQNGYPR